MTCNGKDWKDDEDVIRAIKLFHSGAYPGKPVTIIKANAKEVIITDDCGDNRHIYSNKTYHWSHWEDLEPKSLFMDNGTKRSFKKMFKLIRKKDREFFYTPNEETAKAIKEARQGFACSTIEDLDELFHNVHEQLMPKNLFNRIGLTVSDRGITNQELNALIDLMRDTKDLNRWNLIRVVHQVEREYLLLENKDEWHIDYIVEITGENFNE